MKVLEKALFAVGGLLTGVTALAMACTSSSSVQTPAPAATRAILPTQSIQLKRLEPSPTVIPTSSSPKLPQQTQISTSAPMQTPSFVEVITDSCRRKIGIYDYKRSPSLKEGWDKIEGELWIFGGKTCGISEVDRKIILGEKKFFSDDDGWYMFSEVGLNFGWDGAISRELGLEGISLKSLPYTTYLAHFSFEIPKVVSSFYFDFKPGGRIFCDRGDPCRRPQPTMDANKYIKISGRLSSSDANPDLYNEWFKTQITPAFVQEMVSINAYYTNEVRLTLEDFSTQPPKIKMKIENLSRERDNTITSPEIYLLSKSGSPISNMGNDRYQFSAGKQTLPPGYTTSIEINIPPGNLVKDTRYVLFAYPNDKFILDMGENFVPPSPTPK